jgi:hypothetical protein
MTNESDPEVVRFLRWVENPDPASGEIFLWIPKQLVESEWQRGNHASPAPSATDIKKLGKCERSWEQEGKQVDHRMSARATVLTIEFWIGGFTF